MEWVETTAKSVEDAKELALDQLGVTADEAEFEVLEEPRPGLFGRVRGEARVRARVRPTTPRAKVERRDRRKGRETKATKAGSGDAGTPAEEPANEAADAVNEEAASPAGEAGTADKPAPRASKSRQPAKSAGRRPSARTTSTDAAPQESAPAASTTGGTDVSAQQVGDEAARFLDGLAEAFGIESSTTVETEGDEIEVKLDGADVGMLIGQRGATLLAIQDLTRVVAQRRLGDHETRLRESLQGLRQ